MARLARRGQGPQRDLDQRDLDHRAVQEVGAATPDAALAALAAQGDQEGFDRLYRRHASGAWRVAHAITGNPHDSADAVAEAFTRVLAALEAGRLEDGARFRSYLLSATRNASLDVMRRSGRWRPTASPETFEAPAQDVGPSDRLLDRLDASLVAAAFRSLPERWRSVLWLTEVEGIPAREAAALLGMSANGVAQLAVRARAGLRERFLQAHLRADVESSCRSTVDHLGAYVGGSLAPRDMDKVDQHLAGCAVCAARKEELEDTGSSLRRVIVPIPLGLAGLAASRWKGALASAHAGKAARPAGAHGAVRRVTHHRSIRASRAMIRAHRPLMTMSLGLLALSIIGATIVGQQGPLQVPGRLAAPHAGGPVSITVNPGGLPLTDAAALSPEAAGPAVVAGTATAAPASAAESVAAAAARSVVAGTTLSSAAAAASSSAARPTTAPAGGAQQVATPAPSPSQPTGPANPPPPPTPPPSSPPGGGSSGGGSSGSPAPPPLAQATTSANLGPATAGAAVGAGSGSCTGAAAGLAGSPTAVRCAPAPPPGTPAVSAGTSGSLVPTQTVHIP
ncbi:MAG TPA: sigma-70 family RNA polymerase sigma factor [Acidimicrobiales bacterium]|nr:sigma-70 family RNA polymerase sigma factor [Acidimicrobiales bacterium]